MLVLTRRPGETLVIEPDLDTVGPDPNATTLSADSAAIQGCSLDGAKRNPGMDGATGEFPRISLSLHAGYSLSGLRQCNRVYHEAIGALPRSILFLPRANPAFHFLVGHYAPAPRIREPSFNHLFKGQLTHDFFIRRIFRLRLNNFGHFLFDVRHITLQLKNGHNLNWTPYKGAFIRAVMVPNPCQCVNVL